MAGEMHRGQSQVLWRYGPGVAFRYNENAGWSSVETIDMANSGDLVPAQARALYQALRHWDAIGPTGYPDPITEGRRYVAGEPAQVRYTLWPVAFSCRRCKKFSY